MTKTSGKKEITIKMKDYQLNHLKSLLNSVSREQLFIEGKTTSCENKWQALTLQNKIFKAIEKANLNFNNFVIEKIDKILEKFDVERKTMLVEFEAIKDNGNEEEKKKKAKEQAIYKEDWAKRQNEEFENIGYKVFGFPFGQTIILFVEYKNEEDSKEVELLLDQEFNQLDFIKEQFENFYRLPIKNSILAELVPYFLK